MHSLFMAHPYRLKKIREGGKNANKMEMKYFYFYSDFWKNRVGSPENQKIKKIMALCWYFIPAIRQIKRMASERR